MRKLLILLLTIFTFSSFAQDIDWEIYFEKNGVIINKGIIDCAGNELLTFEIINTNNKKVVISWYEEVWVDELCKQNGQSTEDFRTLTLNPNKKVIGSCSFKRVSI